MITGQSISRVQVGPSTYPYARAARGTARSPVTPRIGLTAWYIDITVIYFYWRALTACSCTPGRRIVTQPGSSPETTITRPRTRAPVGPGGVLTVHVFVNIIHAVHSGTSTVAHFARAVGNDVTVVVGGPVHYAIFFTRSIVAGFCLVAVDDSTFISGVRSVPVADTFVACVRTVRPLVPCAPRAAEVSWHTFDMIVRVALAEGTRIVIRRIYISPDIDCIAVIIVARAVCLVDADAVQIALAIGTWAFDVTLVAGAY